MRSSTLLIAAHNMAKDVKYVSTRSFDGNILIKVRDPDVPEGIDVDAKTPTKIVRIMCCEDLEM